jgi:hypothetical protein
MGLSLVAANPSPLEPMFRVRNAPGMSDLDTMRALRRALSEAAVLRRDTVLENSTTIGKSWNGAVLYQHTLYAYLHAIAQDAISV